MNNKYKSVLKDSLIEFVTYKRYCGYKYKSEINVLENFDKYYGTLNKKEIEFSREIVEPFLALKEKERVSNQANKASILRQFGKFILLNGYVENIYIIPPISLKGEKEYIPHIFSKEELLKITYFFNNYDNIVNVPKGSFIKNVNMINSVKTIIQILMFTGMRIGEVCNLKLNNIDLDNNILYVDEAKNDNCRLVPFSNTLKKIIIEYINNASIYFKQDFNYLFFHINSNNEIKKISRDNVSSYFLKALKILNISHERGKGPRLHDFRHSYCVMALTQMTKNETDINSALSYLSTYIGHKSFNETQKYIWLTPELFNSSLIKMEDYSSFIKDIFDRGDYDE